MGLTEILETFGEKPPIATADLLMLVLSPPGQPWDFDIGLVPGVVLGSFLAALWAKELKLEGFTDGLSMRRYIAGALCMGFGGMLAGAGLADALIDKPARQQALQT